MIVASDYSLEQTKSKSPSRDPPTTKPQPQKQKETDGHEENVEEVNDLEISPDDIARQLTNLSATASTESNHLPVQPLVLSNHDTGEIGQQSYDLNAPPSRHNRADTLHIQHKKRGTLTDLKSLTPSPSPDQYEKRVTSEPFSKLLADKDIARDDKGSNESDEDDDDEHSVINTTGLKMDYSDLMDGDDDGLSDIVTPQPREVKPGLLKKRVHSAAEPIKEAPEPTAFGFADEIKKDNKDKDVHPDFADVDVTNEEEDGLGDLQNDVKQIMDNYENGKTDDSITPISKQKYNVKPPPTKHQRDHSTVHDRITVAHLPTAQDVKELKEKLVARKSAEVNSGSSGESETDEDEIGDVMTVEQLKQLENQLSAKPIPKSPGLHNVMSTGTKQYIESLGLTVMKYPDGMDAGFDYIDGNVTATDVEETADEGIGGDDDDEDDENDGTIVDIVYEDEDGHDDHVDNGIENEKLGDLNMYKNKNQHLLEPQAFIVSNASTATSASSSTSSSAPMPGIGGNESYMGTPNGSSEDHGSSILTTTPSPRGIINRGQEPLKPAMNLSNSNESIDSVASDKGKCLFW